MKGRALYARFYPVAGNPEDTPVHVKFELGITLQHNFTGHDFVSASTANAVSTVVKLDLREHDLKAMYYLPYDLTHARSLEDRRGGNARPIPMTAKSTSNNWFLLFRIESSGREQ